MRFSRLAPLAFAAVLAACSGEDEVCDDRQDNDGNGFADCDDPACPGGTACGPHGVVCGAVGCTSCPGNGGSPGNPGESACADGADNDCDGAVDCADPDCPAIDCIPGGTEPAVLGALRVASIQYPVMGARHSGDRERNAITFQALDSAGRPYPAGLTVRFEHVTQGGSYLGLAPTPQPGSPNTFIAEGKTDALGQATVLLTGGKRFALLSVRAKATANGVTVTAAADDIAVVGVKPNGAHIGLDCRPWNVPALAEHDCMVSKYAGPGTIVDCTLTLADRHGIVVGFPTLAAFWSEAGAAGDPVLSAAYDPAATPQEQAEVVGRAIGYVSVLGQPLPWDVAPFEGEEHALRLGDGTGPDFGCGVRVANPRDGLVTVIALVAGEEGYVDSDSNGQRDPGEPFVDIGEPFVDANDNGAYDDREPFQDLDENGVWTEPNGSWDPDTILWTQTRIVYTGQPAFGDVPDGIAYSRIYDEGSPPFATPPAPEFTGDRTYGVYLADENFNPLSGLTEYGAQTAVGNAAAKLPHPPGSAESLGAMFRLLYCNATESQCAYGPPQTACIWGEVCRVRPDVGGFTYGTWLDLGIDCTLTGPDVAFVTAKLNGVTSALSVAGRCP